MRPPPQATLGGGASQGGPPGQPEQRNLMKYKEALDHADPV
jgi:hypothetical protein